MKRMLLSACCSVLGFLGIMAIPLPGFAQGYDITYNTTPNGYQTLKFNLLQHCGSTPAQYANFPVTFVPSNAAPVTEICGPQKNALWSSSPCSMMPSFCTHPLDISMGMYEHDFNANPINTSGPVSIVTRIPAGVFPPFQSANIAGTYTIQPETYNLSLPNVTNRSPVFTGLPQVTVFHNQPASYSCGAIDPDGDSLVYSLRPISPNAVYAPGYTYLNPVASNPALTLNPATGLLTFRPTGYVPVSDPSSPLNRYMVGIQVDEYRSILGQGVKMGTIQRNLLITVISDANNVPAIAGARSNLPVLPNAISTVLPGSVFEMDITVSDSDLQDVLNITSNIGAVLPGATVTVMPGTNPRTAKILWTASSAYKTGRPYYFNITASDNHCPNPAQSTQTYGVRVLGVLGRKNETEALQAFSAMPNPFSGEVAFRLNHLKPLKGRLLVYNQLGKLVDEILIERSGPGGQEISWQNAAGFPAGQYLVKLVAEGETARTIKVIKLQ